MVWTQKSELPLIKQVCQAVVTDAVAGAGLKLGSAYAALAPTLFGSVPLSITSIPKSATDLTAVSASAGTIGISLSIGVHRSTEPMTRAILTLGGALCHEFVHQKQRARDLRSFAMATDIQTHWRANRPRNPLPQEWLVAYYATIYEFEAHAEQIAYELWLSDTIAGQTPRRSENLAGIPASEALERIMLRLMWAGPPIEPVRTWLYHFEAKIKETLASW